MLEIRVQDGVDRKEVFVPHIRVPNKHKLLSLLALALALTACRNPDFAISGPSAPINAQRGSSVAATVNIARIDGFDGAVTLELTNPPAGVTAPSLSVPANSSSAQLTLSLGSSVAPGALELTVTGSALGKTKPTSLKLNVTAPATDFTLSAQNSPSITQGQNAILGVKLDRKAGFDGPVVIDLQSPPNGVTVSPIALASGVSSGTLSVSVAASVAPGTVPLTTSASLTVSAAQEFTIAPTGSSSLTSPQDRTLTVPIAITRLGGFAEALQFSLEGDGLGSGADKIQATFTPNPVPGAGGATSLELKIGAQVTPKIYDLTVRATAGGQNRTAALRLEVLTPPVVIGAPAASVVRLREVGASSFTVPFTRAGGFTDAVQFTAQAPAGLQVYFGTNPTTANTIEMTVYATVQAALGPNTITLSTTSLGAQNVSASFSVNVLQPDFTIQASNPANPGANTITIPSGSGIMTSSRSLNVSVANPQNGFDGAVSLSVTGLPSGASFTGINVQPGQVQPLQITLGSGVTPGSYPITITGSHPGLSAPKTVAFTLEVEFGERLYEIFSGVGSSLPNGWGTNQNASAKNNWVGGGAAFAYANRAGAGNMASLVSPTIPMPSGGFSCDGQLLLSFTSYFGDTGSGTLKVLVNNDLFSTPISIATPTYVAGGIFRLEPPITLNKTYFSSGNDARLIFEFTPSSNAVTEYWGVDNVLVACR
jgi:hypothetical protein